MKIVFTGGHHTSAMPVLALLKEKYSGEISLFWIGHKYSSKGDKNPTLEFLDISALEIPFYALKTGKFYKTFNPLTLMKIPLGFLHSFFLLIKIRPRLIVSFGGYLAVPVVVVGWLLGIPSITHEQTTVVGWANKVISRFAKKVMITWQNSEKFFQKDKIVRTGLPVRSEIFVSKSSELDLNPNLPTIYVTAGKTGSHKINKVVLECLAGLLDIANVVHQSGNNSVFNDFEALNQKYLELKGQVKGVYNLRKFVLSDQIGEAMSKSSMLICRGGAHTCVEIISLKKPSLIIPIPWVSHNEQLENARAVEGSGLAKVLEEKNLSVTTLLENVTYILKNIHDFKLVEESAASYSSPNSAQLILNEILRFKEN